MAAPVHNQVQNSTHQPIQQQPIQEHPTQEQHYMQQTQQPLQQIVQQPVQNLTQPPFQQPMQQIQQLQQFQQGAQQPWMQQPTAESPTQFSYPQDQNFPPATQISYQHQPLQLQTQATGRIEKSSILALYKYPQLAPARPQQEQQIGSNISSIESSLQPPQAANLPPGVMPGVQRSATMPVSSGSKNPFGRPAANGMAPHGDGGYHGYQESVDGSGRHSPDAFASLSARFVR